MSNDNHVEREISELHAFFVQWYAGTLPETDEAFGRFANVMAPGFCIITPDGSLIERETLIGGLRQAYGSHRDTPGGFAIDIRSVNVRFESEDVTLATYEEWQRSGATAERGRMSTVLFTHEEKTPNGLIWRHVHETWLAENAS